MKKLIISVMVLFSSQIFANDFDTVDYVDLDRFMMPWYVQSHTPTFVDRGGVNQIETYKLNDKGEVETTFTFYNSLGGKKRTLSPKATIVDDGSNAHWKMQFLWPFKHDYLVVRLAEDYSYTVISVPSKKMIWIMSASPEFDETVYDEIVDDLESNGYAVDQLAKVKQSW